MNCASGSSTYLLLLITPDNIVSSELLSQYHIIYNLPDTRQGYKVTEAVTNKRHKIRDKGFYRRLDDGTVLTVGKQQYQKQ